MMQQDALKQKAAEAALRYIPDDSIIGVGTGSTVNYFIDALASIKHRIDGAVASSLATASRLRAHGIPVYDLNTVNQLPIYVDGADEVNSHFQLIKGGGGALTGEKILAAAADQFICVVDASKQVDILGSYPLAVEVIPMARGYVARELVKLGGHPVYREGFVSDYGNIILDVYHLQILQPQQLEQALNQITGVVCHGLFATLRADKLLVADPEGIKVLKRS